MPHHLIVRLRSWPLSWEDLSLLPEAKAGQDRGQSRKRHNDGRVACAIEVVDIIGALLFVAGSVCFLPSISHKLWVFLLGCALFIVGGVIYTALSAFTLAEAVRVAGWESLEVAENVLYLVGSIIFTVGTVLYWPEESHYQNIEWMKSYSLGVYFNLFTTEFEGTILFIIGSVLFGMAAFVNGLNQGRDAGDGTAHSGLFSATTSLYLAGSLLFVVGSFAFLPDLGVTEEIVTIGAWCFIIGSAFYVIGSLISLSRVLRQLRDGPLRCGLLEKEAKI